MLEFKNVSLGYGRKSVLRDLNFAVSAGDFIGIVGQNGSGKTTMLRAIMGILKPRDGSITLENNIRIGYVPQLQTIDDIFPLTVREVVDMGSRKKTAQQRMTHVLHHVGLEALADMPYRDLSGGLRQRTLIAQALVSDPGLLLLDEPTNDLDLGSGKAIMDLLKELNERHGITVIMVSHLVNTVVNYARKIGFLKDGNFVVGTVEEIVTKEKMEDIYETRIEIRQIDGQSVIIAE